MFQDFSDVSPEMRRVMDTLVNEALRDDPVWQDYMQHIHELRAALKVGASVDDLSDLAECGLIC